MASSNKYIKYVKSWENDPNLKEWIAPMVGDTKAAYCKVCRRPFHPHKKDLLLHSKSKKHLKNLSKYRELFASCQPLKDAQYGDGSYEPPNPPYPKQTPKKDVTIAVFSESQEVIHEEDLTKALGEEMKDTASIVISDDPSVFSGNSLYQWKNIPEFRGWLEIDSERLYCKVCCRDLKPSKTEIFKHSSGKIHQRKCMKQGILVTSSENDISLSLLYNQESSGQEEKVIDLRSDTITQPSKEMKSAMLNAEIGDDAFGDDPTVKELEEKVANLLGKQSGLLVPSGTMANLIAILTHCWSRDSEVIIGDESYLNRWSQGGLARMGGIHTKPIKNESDGTFSLARLKSLLEDNIRSPWVVQTLVCIENPHSRMGGKVLPTAWLDQLSSVCVEQGVLLHMDGARLLNASVSCGSSPLALARHCDSCTLCLNKGLGAPMGSVLVGSGEFIERAKRIRTMLGGTMHQAGIFAAAGIYALDDIAPKLHWDHANARAIAQANLNYIRYGKLPDGVPIRGAFSAAIIYSGVQEVYSSAVMVDLNGTQTNFVHLHTDNIRVSAKDLCERLATIKEKELPEIGEQVKILMMPLSDNIVRFVTHYDLSKWDVELVVRKMKLVIEEYDNMLELNFDKPQL